MQHYLMDSSLSCKYMIVHGIDNFMYVEDSEDNSMFSRDINSSAKQHVDLETPPQETMGHNTKSITSSSLKESIKVVNLESSSEDE